MTTSNNFRVQLVYRDTDDVHYIILDNASYESAKQTFDNTNAGIEVDVQLINFETGEVIETTR